MPKKELTEFNREELIFTLTRSPDGHSDPVIFDLTPAEKIVFYRRLQYGEIDTLNLVDNPDEFVVLTADEGTLKLIPSATYWAAGIYFVRIGVTVGGKEYIFPSTQGEVWQFNVSGSL